MKVYDWTGDHGFVPYYFVLAQRRRPWWWRLVRWWR